MAKLKFDKEFFIKNRFWLLLGLIPLFFLIGLLVLTTSVAGDRDEARNKYNAQLTGLQGIKNVKNANFIDPLKAKQKTLQDHKNKVWARVWESQADMMTFPSSSRAPLARFSKQYFGDEIPDLERREFAFDPHMYFGQLEKFKQPPGPVYYLGGWEKVIQPVLKWNSAPTTEECWLAQEDLWVKWELLGMIKNALEAVAQFDDVAIFKVTDGPNREGFTPEGYVARQVCRTPHLELDLLIEEKKEEKKPEVKDPPEKKPEGDKPPEKKPPALVLSPKSTLKNISPDKQPHSLEGLQLRLQQRDAKGAVLAQADWTIKNDQPLAWDKSLEAGEPVPLGKLDPKEPIEVVILEDRSDPLPKGFLARQRFRNPSWELELLIEENDKKQVVISPKSKIKNIHVNHRTLSLHDLQLLVKQPGQTPVTLRVQGEPLSWNETTEVREGVRIDNFNIKRPVEVEQILDWTTSPIKRIDDIRLGYHSHRTAEIGYHAKKFAGTPEPTVELPPIGGNTDTDRQQAAETAAATAGKTPNGLERNRYYDVTNQVRRLPLGVLLVVDQAHIQDVLTAFSNSRLRIQPTQVHFQHVRGVGPQPPPGSERDPEKPGTIEKPGFPRPNPKLGGGGIGTLPPRPGGENPGGVGKPPFGQPVADQGRTGADEDPNLVQLAVYGIASLYERYPPRQGGPEGSNPPPSPSPAPPPPPTADP